MVQNKAILGMVQMKVTLLDGHDHLNEEEFRSKNKITGLAGWVG